MEVERCVGREAESCGVLERWSSGEVERHSWQLALEEH